MNRSYGAVFAGASSLVVLVTLSEAQAPRTGALRGSITDGARALASATVEVFGAKRSAVTTESGTFQFDSLAPGRYWIGVRRIGFLPTSFTATLEADSVRVVSVSLEPAPYKLSDLEVSGGMTRDRYYEFKWRSRGAWGRLLTRDDIQRARPFDLIDLVQRNLPGRTRWALEQTNWFDPSPDRFAAARGDWPSAGFSPWGTAGTANCAPGISINGSTPWPGATLRDYSLDDVEAMEVYRRGGWAPIEFVRASGCGLVVLWLR